MWRSRSSQFWNLWGHRYGAGQILPCYRSASTVPTVVKLDIREGKDIEGFVIQRVEKISEFNMTAIMLSHKLTGAQYMHLLRDDNNNTFSVGFRTTPFDSTGLPHILEHTTLCGSVRYPCRDPFFKMLNRSMATFMNALTGPDYTMYPFATQNLRDYKNLMSVYLDAVFNPRLREMDFRQEGWRLEHEEVKNSDSPIIFKGVVFNEMKGALSDPQSVFGQALLNNILPSHTYGFISGGDPNKIPLLSYEDLKAFHHRYYSPSNARFYSYGNFPLIDQLKFINENFLNTFNGKDILDSSSTRVPSEERWTAYRRKHVACRFDPLAANPRKQSTISIGALLDDIKDIDSGFDWNVLSELLVSGPNSAFYKTLVEPQIGAGFSTSTGFENQTRDTFFSVGLQGVSPQDFGEVVDIYNKTIDSVVNKGFEQQLINAILHGIELNIKHEVSNFGLGMLFALTPLWMHEGDTIKALRVNDQISQFRQRLKDNPRYLQSIVEQKLKANAHKLILTMTPDEEYEERLEEEERKLLENKISKLSAKDRDNLYVQGLELLAEQSMHHDVSVLPTLRVDDLDQDIEAIALKDISLKQVPVQCSLQPTNNIVYFRGIINVSHLRSEQKLLLPLFANIITKMGTKKYTYRELDQRINLNTGGISFLPHLRDNVRDCNTCEEGLLFSSYALDRNVGEMFNILSDLFNDLTLEDLKRFETLIKMFATRLANSIIGNGHMFAILSAGALINGSTSCKESFSGLTHVEAIREISQLDDLSNILMQLKCIATSVLNKEHLRCALNYTPSSEHDLLKLTESFLDSIPGEVRESSILSMVPKLTSDHNGIHHVLPIPINFAAKAVHTVSYANKDHAPLTVTAQLLGSKYLHPLIREKGGAYGSGAVISTSGAFTFYSYRDPNSILTFNAFDGIGAWLNEGKFSDSDIEEAKLGVFQKLDAPVSPGQKGMDRFLLGMTDAVMGQRRQRLMAVNRNDILRVANQFLCDNPGQYSGRALLGPANSELQKTRSQEIWYVKSHD